MGLPNIEGSCCHLYWLQTAHNFAIDRVRIGSYCKWLKFGSDMMSAGASRVSTVVREPEQVGELEPIRYVNVARFAGDIFAAWNRMCGNDGREWTLQIDLWGRNPDFRTFPSWLSVTSLALLLTLMQATRVRGLKVSFVVTLFPTDVLRFVNHDLVDKPTKEFFSRFRERLRFVVNSALFEHFPDDVILTPSLDVVHSMAQRLRVDDPKRKHKYSSTMMPLHKYSDSIAKNTELAYRLANVKNILRNQLYTATDAEDPRRSASKAERASSFFMFELTKNTYQHSHIQHRHTSKLSGYAAAEMTRYPQSFDEKRHLEIFPQIAAKGKFTSLSSEEMRKQVRFLSINVSDFGCGVISRARRTFSEVQDAIPNLREAYADKADELAALDLLQTAVTGLQAYSPSDIVRFVSTTAFTSKIDLTQQPPSALLHAFGCESPSYSEVVDKLVEARHLLEDTNTVAFRVWDPKSKSYVSVQKPLSPSGYGLAYCLTFVAIHFATVTVTTEGTQTVFKGTPEAFKMFRSHQWDLFQGLAHLLHEPESVVSIESRQTEWATAFPGTQITLDIPVFYRWAEVNSELESESREEFHQVYTEFATVNS